VTIQINKLKKAININQSILIIAINGKCEELIISAGNIFYILKTPCDKNFAIPSFKVSSNKTALSARTRWTRSAHA